MLEKKLQFLRHLESGRQQVPSCDRPEHFDPPPFLFSQRLSVRQYEASIARGHFEKIARRALRDRVVRLGSVFPEASRISSIHIASFVVTIVPKICAMAASSVS